MYQGLLMFIMSLFIVETAPLRQMKLSNDRFQVSPIKKTNQLVKNQTLQPSSEMARIKKDILDDVNLKKKLFPPQNRDYLNKIRSLKRKEDRLIQSVVKRTKMPLKLGGHWEYIRSQIEFFSFIFFLVELFIMHQISPSIHIAVTLFVVSVLFVSLLLCIVDQLIRIHAKRSSILLMTLSQMESSQEHFIRVISNESIFLKPSGIVRTLISQSKYISLGSFFSLMALLVLGIYNRYLIIPLFLFIFLGATFLCLQWIGEKKFRLSEQVFSFLEKDKGRFYLLKELKNNLDKNKQNQTSPRHVNHEKDRFREVISQYILTMLVVMLFLFTYLLIKATGSEIFLLSLVSLIILLLFWVIVNTFFFKLGSKQEKIKEITLGVIGGGVFGVSGIVAGLTVGLIGFISPLITQILFIVSSLLMAISLVCILSFIYQVNRRFDISLNSKDVYHKNLYIRQNTQIDYLDEQREGVKNYPRYILPFNSYLRVLKMFQDFFSQLISSFSFILFVILIEIYLGVINIQSVYFIIGMAITIFILMVSIGAYGLLVNFSGAKGFIKNHFRHRRVENQKVYLKIQEPLSNGIDNQKERGVNQYEVEFEKNEFFQNEELILGGGLKRKGSQWGWVPLIKIASILFLSLSLSLAVWNLYFLFLSLILFLLGILVLGGHQMKMNQRSKYVLTSLITSLMMIQIVIGICLASLLSQWLWGLVSFVGILFWSPLIIKNIFFIHKEKKETPLMVDLAEKHLNETYRDTIDNRFKEGVLYRYDKETNEEKMVEFVQEQLKKAVKEGKEKVCLLLDVDGTLYSADHRERTRGNYFLVKKLLEEYPFVEVVLISGRHYFTKTIIYNLFPITKEIDTSLYERLWLAPNNGAIVVPMKYFIDHKDEVMKCEESEVPYLPLKNKCYIDPLKEVRLGREVKGFTKDEQERFFKGIDYLGRVMGIPQLIQCSMEAIIPYNLEYISIELSRKELADEDQEKIAQLSNEDLRSLFLHYFSKEEQSQLHVMYSGKASDEETFTFMVTRKWKNADGKEYMVRKSNIFLLDNLRKLNLDKAWMIGLGDSTKPGGNDRDFIAKSDLRVSVLSQKNVNPQTEEEFHFYGDGTIEVFSQLYHIIKKALDREVYQKEGMLCCQLSFPLKNYFLLKSRLSQLIKFRVISPVQMNQKVILSA